MEKIIITTNKAIQKQTKLIINNLDLICSICKQSDTRMMLDRLIKSAYLTSVIFVYPYRVILKFYECYDQKQQNLYHHLL